MRIRCLSYNIHKGLNWNNSVHILPKLKEFLQSLDLEFVFLQEVVGENKLLPEKFSTWVDNQHEFLADSVWTDYAYSQNAVYDKRHHGNAILSKYPIISHHVYDLTQHKREMRALLYCEVETPEGRLDLYCTHLNLLHHHRRAQYEKINEVIAENYRVKKNPIVLAGDLNDWFKKSHHHVDLLDACHIQLDKKVKTFPHILPIVQLDHFYSYQIKPVGLEVIKPPLMLSDHLPLLFTGEVFE
tara:strand:- start:27306 stop:28031 length:726 start_codon:yes stop_codon:yes gene_type:complete